MAQSATYKISLIGWEGFLTPGKAEVNISINNISNKAVLSEYLFKLTNKFGQELKFSVYKTSNGHWYNPFFNLTDVVELPKELIDAAKEKVDEINSQITIKI